MPWKWRFLARRAFHASVILPSRFFGFLPNRYVPVSKLILSMAFPSGFTVAKRRLPISSSMETRSASMSRLKPSELTDPSRIEIFKPY